MEVIIQDYGNVPAWIKFPHKEWDQPSIGSHHLELIKFVQVPFGTARMTKGGILGTRLTVSICDSGVERTGKNGGHQERRERR